MTCKSRLAAGAIAVSLLAANSVAQDWTQWRGPNRDGAIVAFSVPTAWPQSLTERWSVDIGTGYATPLVVGDRIYQFSRLGDNEVMTALSAQTGEAIWQSQYAAPFEMVRAAAGHGPGPKSTPSLVDGRLFTLGMTGIVTAFDAESGKQLWQTPESKVHPLYHTAMSPIIDGERVILHIGGHDDGALTAFDASTGDVQWQWTGDGPAYGSPMIFDLAGTRQVVTFTQAHMVGVSVETGALLWQRPYTTSHDTTSLTPILYKDMVIETGRGNGITAFRVSRNGTSYETSDVWHTDDASMYMTNGVAMGSLLVGLSHLNSGQYFGLDLDAGRVLWTSEPRQAENAAILATENVFFSLEEDGELLAIGASRTGFEVLARYQVADSTTWAQPTFFGGDEPKVLVKDVSKLTLWTFE